MTWFLDFIGYNCPGYRFIVKEIAIIDRDDEDRCYNYFITGPKAYPIWYSQTIHHQYKWHNLRWEFGDYEFNEAMMDIARKMGEDTVYIKGTEKYDFMRRRLPRPKFVELEDIPAVCYLNSCTQERCNVKHGDHCARRRVYELRHYIINNDSFYK